MSLCEESDRPVRVLQLYQFFLFHVIANISPHCFKYTIGCNITFTSIFTLSTNSEKKNEKSMLWYTWSLADVAFSIHSKLIKIANYCLATLDLEHNQ